MTHVIAGLLLAAGMSRRSGVTNKLLATVNDEVMVVTSLRAMSISKCDPMYVVTGHQAGSVREALAAPSIRFIHNSNYGEGMASSISAGVMALDADVDGVVIGLGDMPHVNTATINALIEAFALEQMHDICMPTYEGRTGNPVLFGRRHFPDLVNLHGDLGAKSVIQNNPANCAHIAVDDPGIHLDHDYV